MRCEQSIKAAMVSAFLHGKLLIAGNLDWEWVKKDKLNDQFWLDRFNREKWCIWKGGQAFSTLFLLDWTDRVIFFRKCRLNWLCLFIVSFGFIWRRLTPDLAVRVQALARDVVLCSWARHFTLTVPFSTQVYKWVPVNLILGNHVMD